MFIVLVPLYLTVLPARVCCSFILGKLHPSVRAVNHQRHGVLLHMYVLIVSGYICLDGENCLPVYILKI